MKIPGRDRIPVTGFGLFFLLAALPLAALAQFTGGPPVITKQPESQFVAAGTDVTFRVGVAPSFTPLKYRWQKSLVDMVGATNATLVITNVTSGDAGTYSVAVANAAGAIQSAPATLAVA